MSAVTEPGVSRNGRTLLYRVRINQIRWGRWYPLKSDNDWRGAWSAIRGGYLRRSVGTPDLVTLTPKGEDYLDRLMRCE